MRRSSIPFMSGLSMLLIGAVAIAACSPPSQVGGGSGEQESSVVGDGPLDRAAMKEAVARALENPDTLDRLDAIVDLMRRLDASNVEGAMEAYDDVVSGLDRDEVRLFANAWARIDPKAALDRFTKWRAPRVGQSAISEVVTYWTRHGGAEEASAYAMASLGPDRPENKTIRNIVLDATVTGLAGAGEHAALTKLLEPLPADQERAWLVTQAILEFYRSGPDAVRAWIDSIPWEAQNDLKREALHPGLVTLAEIDPKAAFAWYETVEAKLPAGALLEQISQAAGAKDPLANLEWLLLRGESDGRMRGLRAGAYHYLKADGPVAAEWITARLDEPGVKAGMLLPLAQYTFSIDLQKSLPLAEQIEAPGEKIQMLKTILVRWSREDFPAVEKYMAEARVPREVENAVRQMNSIRTQQKRAKAPAGQG
jgi:hypothetical protein